jgi:lipopolysaccharide export system protein LptC
MPSAADRLKRLERLRQRHSPLATHRSYSRFVRVMKMVLPALAVVLLGLVVAWPRLHLDDDRFRVGFAGISAKSVQNLAMVNARYFGVDKNNKPFTVTADRAEQAEGKPDEINLDQPKADFTSRDGAGVFLGADRGNYHQKAQLLDLANNVSLYHEKGYELHTEQAQVNLGDNTAWGDHPVQGQGPQGRLQGEGFRIRDRGGDVLITGRSNLTVRGASAKPPGKKGKKKK